MHDATVLAPPALSAEAMPARSDDDLVHHARVGSMEARDELARRFRGPAYVLALQLLGNRDDAFDVAQDSLLRVFAGLGQFAPGRPLRPWVLAIVRNQARDLWRRQRVRRTESIDALEDGLANELTDAAPDPEQAASHRELRRRLWRAMAVLSADHREIIVLRDFHGLSYAEIAQLLSIKSGTVMSRLHSARAQLRSVVTRETHHA